MKRQQAESRSMTSQVYYMLGANDALRELSVFSGEELIE